MILAAPRNRSAPYSSAFNSAARRPHRGARVAVACRGLLFRRADRVPDLLDGAARRVVRSGGRVPCAATHPGRPRVDSAF